MNNYAIVIRGVVDNIVVWDGDENSWQPPDGSLAVLIGDGDMASIGNKYDGEDFVDKDKD